MLGLVVGDDLLEVADLQFLAGLVPDDGAERVEQLALVEPVLAVAADLGDDRVEIVEHDVLLRCLPLCVRAVRLLHRLADGVADLA